MKLFKRGKNPGRVVYTDGSDRVCDRTCRIETRTEQHKVWALTQGSVPGIR